MRKLLVLAAAAALCAGVPAQSYETAPPGYVSKAGPYAFGQKIHLAYSFGSRWQYGKKAGKARTLVSLDCRTNAGLTYTSSYGMGRKFAKLALTLGHTDCSKFTSRFTLNYIGSGTTVFSGAMSLPTQSGQTKPVWGNCGRMAFTAKFAYNGKNDLLEDWVHTGHTLANGYTSSNYGTSYYCDGCSGSSVTSGWSIISIYPGDPFGGAYVPKNPNSTSTRCADSAYGTTRDAYVYAGATIYNDNYRVTSLRCVYRPYAYAYYGAPSKPYIGALTVGGSDTGIPVGAKCNRLHVNMGFPVVIKFGTLSSSGFDYIIGSPAVYGKYNNAAAGVKVYGQHAWNDSKTSQLGLSIAAKLCLIKKGQGGSTGCPSACYIYRYRYRSGTSFVWTPSATDAGRGWGPYNTNFYNIERFGGS